MWCAKYKGHRQMSSTSSWLSNITQGTLIVADNVHKYGRKKITLGCVGTGTCLALLVLIGYWPKKISLTIVGTISFTL